MARAIEAYPRADFSQPFNPPLASSSISALVQKDEFAQTLVNHSPKLLHRVSANAEPGAVATGCNLRYTPPR